MFSHRDLFHVVLKELKDVSKGVRRHVEHAIDVDHRDRCKHGTGAMKAEVTQLKTTMKQDIEEAH